ncbi:unnamed protein product, partial [Mesorhabditis spiculigera]
MADSLGSLYEQIESLDVATARVISWTDVKTAREIPPDILAAHSAKQMSSLCYGVGGVDVVDTQGVCKAASSSGLR